MATSSEKKKRSAGSAAVFNALNSQVKEREAERRVQIQQERTAELAALKGRNANLPLEQGKLKPVHGTRQVFHLTNLAYLRHVKLNLFIISSHICFLLEKKMNRNPSLLRKTAV